MRYKLLVILVVSILLLVACGGQEAAEEEPISVAFSTIFLGDRFFVRLNDGMQARADEQGVNLILHNPDGDPSAQYAAVEDFITQNVDVIIVDPLDPNGILPALQQAKDAGIPVMAVDEVLDGVELIDAAAGDDNFGVGQELGERLLAYMDDNGIEKATIGVIQTIDAPIENTRFAGFEEVVNANPDRMEVVGRCDAKFSVEESAKCGENLMTANPDLNFFHGTGGNYMIGALAAIRSQGAEDSVKLIGWDLSAQLIEAMKEGLYIVAAEQDAAGIGRAAIDAAVKLAKGEEVARDNYVPVAYVTVDNVDDFAADYQE